MEAWLDSLVSTLAGWMTQNLWFAPVLSLAAGIVTSFTPCSLSAVPMAIAYMEGSGAKDARRAFRLSLTMALGMAVTFGIFGSLASLIGHVMHDVGRWWSYLMGLLMVLMALQIWDVIRILPGRHSHEHGEGCGHHAHTGACPECGMPKKKRSGYPGAFLTGALGGVFASHCAAPVMVALLALVAQSEHTVLWGIFSMVLYAFGHSILLVFAGTGYSVVDGWLHDPKYAKISRRLKSTVGVILLLIGLLMLFSA